MARLLLGVTGGIAAYKSVELARLAIKAGHSVRVVQTPASLNFVGRATFEAITGAPVLVDEWERDPARGAYPGDPEPSHAAISHLELVRRADVFAVAPASANTLAKLAGGFADNLLTSAALASPAPLLIAPAMNNLMWEHPATVANVELLRSRGAVIVPPERGSLASKGEEGVGRLAEPATILAAIESMLESGADAIERLGAAVGADLAAGDGSGFAPRSLDGLRVLVTAGGTREPIDSVRFVGNRSSGRMGFALAEECARRGASVTVVAANVLLPRADGIDYVDVETAAQLHDAAVASFATADVLVMAAAVADFRPASPVDDKIKKSGHDGLTIELEPTVDVLSALSGARRNGQVLVGFAAEHGDVAVRNARGKLERKKLDAVVVNDISKPGIGFDTPENEVTLVTAAGDKPVPRGSKAEVAAAIVDLIEDLRAARHTEETEELAKGDG